MFQPGIRGDVGIAPYASILSSRVKIIIFRPFGRILRNILQPDQIFLFITDNSVIVGPLPNASAQLLGYQCFPGSNQLWNTGLRRGRCPHRPFCWVHRRNTQNQMHMIGHNHIFPHARNRTQVLFNHHSNRCQSGARGNMGIAPCNGTQNTFPILRTDRNEISAWLAVIIISQAILFSDGRHVTSGAPSRRRGGPSRSASSAVLRSRW